MAYQLSYVTAAWQEAPFMRSISPTICREDLLVAAGYSRDARMHIFASQHYWALARGQTVQFRTGQSFAIVPYGVHHAHGTDLVTMLERTDGWDLDASVPEQDDLRFWVLADTTSASVPAPDRPSLQLRRVLSDLLECPPQALTIRATDPRISDYSSQGRRHCAVLVATQTIQRPPPRPPIRPIVVLDLRPLLQELEWFRPLTNVITLQPLLDRFQDGCPPGYTVSVKGGHLEAPEGNPQIRLVDGQVLVIEFLEDFFEEAPILHVDELDVDEDTASEGDHPAQDTLSVRSRSPRRPPEAAPGIKGHHSEASEPSAINVSVVTCQRDSHFCVSGPKGLIPIDFSADGCWRLPLCCALPKRCRLAECAPQLLSPQSSVAHAPLSHMLRPAWQPCAGGTSLPGLVWRLLIEPTCAGPAERSALQSLRQTTLDFGGTWPYIEAPNGPRPPGAGSWSETASTDSEDEWLWVCFAVLVPGHAPDTRMLQLRFPATIGEAVATVQRARPATALHSYPHLLEASPQPVQGHGVFLGGPVWSDASLIACFDLSQIRGCVFAARVPPYCDRYIFMQTAHLPLDLQVDIYVGFYEDPLEDGVEVHMFPGETVCFRWPARPRGAVTSLTQMLLDSASWRHTPPFPMQEPEGAYCVVADAGEKLLQTNTTAPTRYRREIAPVVELPSAGLAIFPAQPRVRDAAIARVTCRTVLAVSSQPDGAADTWHLALLDCRVLLTGWQSLEVHRGLFSAWDLLESLRHAVPAGWLPHLDVDPDAQGFLPLRPGHVLRLGLHRDIPAPLGPAADVLAQAVYAIDTEGAPGVAAPFVVYVPERTADFLEVVLTPGCAVDTALAQVNACRDTAALLYFPGLVEVFPQPDLTYCAVLAVTPWQPPGSFVLFDCRFWDDRAFAAVVPARVTRRTLLAIAQIDPAAHSWVYVRDFPWPLSDDQAVRLAHGDPAMITSTLSDMLQQTEDWPAGLPPGHFDNRVWVLCDPEPFPLLSPREDYRLNSRSIAIELEVDEDCLVLQPPQNILWDHVNVGRASGDVLAVHVRDSHEVGPAPVVFIVDRRPIFLGLASEVATDGCFDVASFVRRFQGSCPPGCDICLRTRETHEALPLGDYAVSPGEVIVVSFQPVRSLPSPAGTSHVVESIDGEDPTDGSFFAHGHEGADPEPRATPGDGADPRSGSTFAGRTAQHAFSTLVMPCRYEPFDAAIRQDAFFEAATLLEVLAEHLGAHPRDGCTADVDPVPLTPFQTSAVQLSDMLPKAAPADQPDWLDSDLRSLISDSCVPKHKRTLFSQIPIWRDAHTTGSPEGILVYSDGSTVADSQRSHDCAPGAWAISVWVRNCGVSYLLGHACGTTRPPDDPYHLGEIGDSPLTCETLGVAWGLIWVIEFAPAWNVPVCCMYDCLSAGRGTFAEARTADSSGAEEGLSTYATYLRQLASQRVRLDHDYVPGHAGDVANELCDELAKRCRRHLPTADQLLLPDWPARVYGHPLKAWIWLTGHGTHDLPTLFSMEEPVAIKGVLLSFNVLSMYDPKSTGGTSHGPGMRVTAKRDILKRQLEHLQAFLFGIQETRLVNTQVLPDKDFLMYHSASDSPTGPCDSHGLFTPTYHGADIHAFPDLDSAHRTCTIGTSCYTWNCGYHLLLLSVMTVDFEALQVHQDHSPVGLRLEYAQKPKSVHRGPGSFARRAIRPHLAASPAYRAGLSGAIQSPANAWDSHIDAHYQALVTNWGYAASSLRAPTQARPVQEYIRPATLTLVHSRRGLREYLWTQRREQRRRLLLLGFAALLHSRQGTTFPPQAVARYSHWTHETRCNIAQVSDRIHQVGLELRLAVRQDRADYLAGLVKDISLSDLRNPKSLYRAVRKAFPAAASKRRQSFQPLPAVQGPDGVLATDSAQRRELWRAHFASLEDGEKLEPGAYSHALAVQKADNRLDAPAFAIGVVPSLSSIEQIVLGLKRGKACGQDGVTAELLRASPALSARALLPVFVESVLAAQEPLEFRGGTLMPLAKKASAAFSCSKFRPFYFRVCPAKSCISICDSV
ncbi:unnamed protein product [Symbiodinium sp. CCMP2592]|nr:unnamed protein product [Symbiodinium sp. CCMP2592]